MGKETQSSKTAVSVKPAAAAAAAAEEILTN